MLRSGARKGADAGEGGRDMDDRLREALATLGQRIEVAEYERQLAVDEVRALVSQHSDLHLSQVAELTLLPQPQLGAMMTDA